MPRLGWTRVLPAVAVATLVGAGVSAPAYAHNQLTSSTPADGEVLDEAPASVTLDFLDTVSPQTTTVSVTGPDGDEAADGPASFDGSEVTVPLRVTSAGRYTVGYELTAADGHVGGGEVGFELTAQAAPGPSPSPSPSPEPAPSAAPAATTPAVAVPPAEAESSSWWPWAAGAAAVLALGLGAVTWFRRRA